ncbi:MAG: lytic transglycosylase domain-containing protein [Desulfobaccales bacterium]
MLNSLTAIVFLLYGSLGFPNLPPIPVERPAIVLQAAAPMPGPALIKKCSSELDQKLEFFSALLYIREGLKVNYLRGPNLTVQIDVLIKKYAKRHGIDENLIRAVLFKESGGNPIAVSPKFAMGLMQLIPETAIAMGVQDPFNPEENIAGGVKYLKYCLDRFSQDVILALAAYNAGPEAVKKHDGLPPYAETQQYVATIIGCSVEDLINIIKPEGELTQTDKPASPQEEKQAGRPAKSAWKVVRAEVPIPALKWKIIPGFPTLNSCRLKVDAIHEAARLAKNPTPQPGEANDAGSQGNFAVPRFHPNYGYR